MKNQRYFIIGGAILVLFVVFLVGKAVTPKSPQQNMPSYSPMNVSNNSGNSIQNGVNGALNNQNNNQPQGGASANSIENGLKNVSFTVTYNKSLDSQYTVNPGIGYVAGTIYPVKLSDFLNSVSVEGNNLTVTLNQGTLGSGDTEISAAFIALYKYKVISPNSFDTVTVNVVQRAENSYGNVATEQVATGSLTSADAEQYNWNLDNYGLFALFYQKLLNDE